MSVLKCFHKLHSSIPIHEAVARNLRLGLANSSVPCPDLRAIDRGFVNDFMLNRTSFDEMRIKLGKTDCRLLKYFPQDAMICLITYLLRQCLTSRPESRIKHIIAKWSFILDKSTEYSTVNLHKFIRRLTLPDLTPPQSSSVFKSDSS